MSCPFPPLSGWRLSAAHLCGFTLGSHLAAALPIGYQFAAMALILLGGGCTEELDWPPGQQQRISGSPAEVDFGAPFPLTVERVWPQGAAQQEWDPAWLAPLHLRELDHHREVRDGQVYESRRLEARVFQLGTIELWPRLVRGIGEGAEDQSSPVGEPLRVEVRSILPPGDPRIAEAPPGPLPVPLPFWQQHRQGILAALIASLVLYGAHRLRSPSSQQQAESVPIDASWNPWLRFEALRTEMQRPEVDWKLFAVRARSLVHEGIYRVGQVEVRCRCREEITARLMHEDRLDPVGVQALDTLLQRSEEVIFATASTQSVGELLETLNQALLALSSIASGPGPSVSPSQQPGEGA